MTTRRLLARLPGALALASLFGFAACQQVLGLDQPTVSVSAISRICECVPLTQQGLTFAGGEGAACETALAEQPDEILLAVAENDCADCANVTSCYAQLTEAGDQGDACSDSSDCATWACCQGVLQVSLMIDGGKATPVLVSDPPEPTCCSGCSACADALANLNSETQVTACAEAEVPLTNLLLCLAEGQIMECCDVLDGVTPECLACLAEQAAAANRCEAEFQACATDPARPIPVPE